MILKTNSNTTKAYINMGRALPFPLSLIDNICTALIWIFPKREDQGGRII